MSIFNCPIAEYLKRNLPEDMKIRVRVDKYIINNFMGKIPNQIGRFITNFDANKYLELVKNND